MTHTNPERIVRAEVVTPALSLFHRKPAVEETKNIAVALSDEMIDFIDSKRPGVGRVLREHNAKALDIAIDQHRSVVYFTNIPASAFAGCAIDRMVTTTDGGMVLDFGWRDVMTELELLPPWKPKS